MCSTDVRFNYTNDNPIYNLRGEIIYFDGLELDCSNSIPDAMELLQSCATSSIYYANFRASWQFYKGPCCIFLVRHAWHAENIPIPLGY